MRKEFYISNLFHISKYVANNFVKIQIPKITIIFWQLFSVFQIVSIKF